LRSAWDGRNLDGEYAASGGHGIEERDIMLRQIIVLVLALGVAPPGAKAADLVVWWEEGYYAQEDEAVREIVAAFEQETGKQVELAFYPQAEIADQIEAAFKAGHPPDFAYGQRLCFTGWLSDGRLVDLTDTIGHFSDLFDPDALAWWSYDNAGERALIALPMGRATNHLHVWKSLLEQAGFTLEDIPNEWDAFWSFWCDEVQPAVRRATGRNDVWGVGLAMSVEAGDTGAEFSQFVQAYEGDWVTREGRLVIDQPDVRQRLIEAVDRYTAIYRNGCTPPASTAWASPDNNKAFLAQTVVMTPNESLSIPNALKGERPDDYYQNTATIEWPLGPRGNAFPIKGSFYAAPIFKDGGHVDTAKEFVRFLVAEGWLAHYLNFAGERMLPPMPKLLDAPFWLDPNDPHRMAAAMQIAARPMQYDYIVVTGDWRYERVWEEAVWPRAVHRVVTEGITPEQAVDKAIARIKQILAE
jgi:multiple sugar transport system substrate-binding protein